ncbi:hypothetical protein [Pseudomonas sp. UBA4034]|uniref:hypothetical protein n=1 Tax=Pseudomonas sp. UBA4034 TaxID=1947315 RepID=UPI00257CEB94|nr:hypothetical protein [Pseudomonas sp. UBA4034]
MVHTIKQHVMPQWVLRNFRSDDTALAEKGKQRVWCHTVYLDENKQNVIKEFPLPISSVGVAKSCFSLIDAETGELFDIEQELSEYELRTSTVFNGFIRNQDFSSLLRVGEAGNSLEAVVNFMTIQMVLNLHNPQHKYGGKELFFSSLMKGLEENFLEVKAAINGMPDYVLELYGPEFSRKIVRVSNSTSDKSQVCKVLFVLFVLAESKGLPILVKSLSVLRDHLFGNIYIEGVYHTGYSFDSIESRPVFAIGPNVFSKSIDGELIYLPIAHNWAFGFSVRKKKFYNSELIIYSANPANLNLATDNQIKLFKVSHDFIDNIVGHVLMGAVGNSNTIYTPHECADVDRYLAMQGENEDFFYKPTHPERVI